MTPPTSILINVDLGELPEEAEELYAQADVANIACGGHAGDGASMTRAVALAEKHRTQLAAHPSYPDRESFGRRSLTIQPAELRASLTTQLVALQAIADATQAPLCGVKLHGALYHDAGVRLDLATAVLEAARTALPGLEWFITSDESLLADLIRRAGLTVWREGFADRGYDASGKLIARAAPGAVIDDGGTAAAQALQFARLGRFDTLCVHGDNPAAIDVVRSVRAELVAHGFTSPKRKPSVEAETDAQAQPKRAGAPR